MSERLTQAQLDAFAKARNALPTCQYFGFKVAFPDGDRVEVTLDDVKPGQRGGLGTSAVNGGVLAAMFDFAIGYAATLSGPLRRSATVQLSLNLERPVLGDFVKCTARIERVARSMLFASAQISDGEGKVCARGTGLCALGGEVDLALWTGARSGGEGT